MRPSARRALVSARRTRVSPASREDRGQRAADDGLDARLGEACGELERAKEIVRVGERERRHRVGARRALTKRAIGQRAFKQRIGGVHAQMHEGDRRARRAIRSVLRRG